MLRELIKLANHLDSKGLTKEADILDGIISKASSENKIIFLLPQNRHERFWLFI